MRRRKKRNWRGLSTAILFGAAIFLLTQYSLRRETPVYPRIPISVDVIVLGSGLTGAVAVQSAVQAGADVFYIDLSEPDAGGFPAFSPAYWASGTAAQEEAGIEYFPERMAVDIFERGREAGDFSLIMRFSEESASHLAWLEEVTASNFSVLVAPETNPGLHSPASGNVETFVMRGLAEDISSIAAGYSRTMKPERLLLSGNRVIGLSVRNGNGATEEIFCQAVILADGGFASEPDMLEEFTGITDTVARPEGGHRGIGLQLAMDIGAETALLDRASVLPIFLPEGRQVPYEAFPGAVLADIRGNAVTFSNTVADTVREAGGRLFVIYGSENRPDDRSFTAVESLSSLATGLGIDRMSAQELTVGLTAPYYVAVAAVTALMPGGLQVDEYFRVTHIDGLYAAGEIAAGLHGERVNVSLVFAESIISARIAAREASNWARR